jgi:EmrB/QacA subfamily drug resistance transporter
MTVHLNRQSVVSAVIIVALFLEFLDQTIITTAIPVIAQDFSVSPVDLKFGLTSYYLAIILVIPASGWIGDRFGARATFLMAIALFSLGSLLCGAASSLPALVAARFVQGVGGALLVPVGRMIILRDVEQSAMIRTLVWLSLPAVFGPMLGPLVGGTITIFFHWKWIFWINLPIGAVALIIAIATLQDTPREELKSFDLKGYALLAMGLLMFVAGSALVTHGTITSSIGIGSFLTGILVILLYMKHSQKCANPLFDPALFKLRTFRASLVGGIPFRIANGSIPFLLPIFFQTGLGYSAFESGLLVFSSGVAAMFMNSRTPYILRRFGFRDVLSINGIITSLYIAFLALLIFKSPFAVMLVFLLMFGLFRSVQYSTITALAYADIKTSQMASATSIVSLTHPLSNAIGVSVGAFVLEMVISLRYGPQVPVAHDFPITFGIICLIGLSSALVFFRLSRDAGRAMTGHV